MQIISLQLHWEWENLREKWMPSQSSTKNQLVLRVCQVPRLPGAALEMHQHPAMGAVWPHILHCQLCQEPQLAAKKSNFLPTLRVLLDFYTVEKQSMSSLRWQKTLLEFQNPWGQREKCCPALPWSAELSSLQNPACPAIQAFDQTHPTPGTRHLQTKPSASRLSPWFSSLECIFKSLPMYFIPLST